MNLKEAYENKYLLDLQMDQIYQNSLISPKPMVMFPSHISDLTQISEYADQISVSTGIKKPSRAKIRPTPKATTLSSTTTSGAMGTREKFIKIVQEAGIISSKAKMQELIEQNGFSSAEFDATFKLLKDKEGVLKYSKSSPRGYSIESAETVIIDTEIPVQSEGTITVESKAPIVKDVPQPTPEIAELSISNEKFLNMIKENQPISSKAKLIELAESIDIDKKSAEALIDQLKELDVFVYSKSAPRGWSAK